MLQTPSEKELAERCRRGEREAFRLLYEQYAGQLMAVCLRYAGDRETARDLLHDGFLKAFRSFGRFTWRGEGSLRAWMVRIMVNEAVDYLRKQEHFGNLLPVETLPDTLPDEEEAHPERIPAEQLMRFIEELPAGYRTVFNLYVLEERSHKEIAALLGIGEKSSSSQLHRARLLLAKRIKDYMENEA